MIVTIAGFKGGIGKTTTAVHLACYLQQTGETILIDGDPNRSATGWNKRGGLPFKVVDLMQAPKVSKSADNMVIDTAARPSRDDLDALADGCDLLILPTPPDALSMDAMVQTLEMLQSLGSDRFKILLTMTASTRKTATMARDALADLPLFDGEIRRFAAYEKAALLGVPVYQCKDKMARIAWKDYQTIGEEMTNG